MNTTTKHSKSPKKHVDETPKKHSTAPNGASQVRVRMFRVGFGDCFLITLGGVHNILVDCGVHNKGNVKVDDESLIDKAFHTIAEVTNKKLDIIIATHAHQDHVSGFGKFADAFGEFEIGEVWLPWTEDLHDAKARAWHDKKASLLAMLTPRLQAVRDQAAAAAVDNAGANPKAMGALRTGFGKAEVFYRKAGDNVVDPAGISGLTAKILGPPDDESFLKKMNPPSSDHYLQLMADADAGKEVHPFPGWDLNPSLLKWPDNWPQLDEKRLKLLLEQSTFPAAAVAFSLDKLLNNTSIVALFTWHGKQLLFPGDAQYGDWISWYKDSGPDLLSNISFYKVSHHGSFNATPKGAVEEMPEKKFAAMMSTQNSPWPSIPREGLVEALQQRTGGAFARADSIAVPGAPNCSDETPGEFHTGNQKKDEYWIDYAIQ